MTDAMMLSGLLSRFEPYLSDICGLPQNRVAMTAISDRLPPLSGGGLECHLDSESHRTDLMLRLTRTDGGQQWLAGTHAAFAFDDSLRFQWPAIHAFGQTWQDSNSVLNEMVENLWLEFDITQVQPEITTTPAVFFEVNRHKQLNLDQQLGLIKAALVNLSPANLSFLSTVRRLLQQLPDNAGLDYAGIMLMRHQPGIRLCLSDFAVTQIEPFLHRISWPGNRQQLQSLLVRFALNADRLVLDLDVTDSVNSGIGVEVFFQQPQSWQALLQQLSRAQRVEQRCVDAIGRWPGVTELTGDPFNQALQEASGANLNYLIRRFNHLKFSLDIEGHMTSKAYMYFCYG